MTKSVAPRLILLAAAALFALGMWWGVTAFREWRAGPSPESVAAASLAGLREQNVLVPFTARYVAVVTSRQTTLGLVAQKTLIVPGTVRYELDLARLRQSDLVWNDATRTLTITLPPLAVARPTYDFSELREYSDGRIIMALTGAEEALDNANRDAADAQINRQARGAVPMRLARDAAQRAVEQSLALPLRAAGIEARVEARWRR